MMPTTSAASTPSRSAIRKAESMSCPVGLVVSHLQLQARVYLSGTLLVNRTNSVRFLNQQDRVFCFLPMGTFRQALSLTLSSLFLFSQASFAQAVPASLQALLERRTLEKTE